VDLFLWDLKDTDPLRHKQYTGCSPEPILENLRMVDQMGAKIRLRCILVNGVNTDEAHYFAVAELAKGLSGLEGVEWIPYHAYGGTKAVFLGGEDSGRREWIPTEEQMARAREVLREKKISE
jgi:pyruvate formate lyase activating enzyme